jgi:hypothetical protein
MAAMILGGRIGRKIEDVLGKDKFGFRRGEEVGMSVGAENNIRRNFEHRHRLTEII